MLQFPVCPATIAAAAPSVLSVGGKGKLQESVLQDKLRSSSSSLLTHSAASHCVQGCCCAGCMAAGFPSAAALLLAAVSDITTSTTVVSFEARLTCVCCVAVCCAGAGIAALQTSQHLVQCCFQHNKPAQHSNSRTRV
jgi:hypothetical protein